VTTRQDFQLHFVHIDDTPDIMRRLAAVGITTREACGNSVRNVTACPLAGVCRDETFDVTPYARTVMRFLLGHPDTQEFGRKFKVALSGCRQHACGLLTIHDLGLLAVTRTENGVERRGFEVYVGGGLGAVPYQAKLFEPFVPEEEILPLAQSIARVFARLGEKRNRARARIKFLVKNLGLDEFKRLVLDERAKLQPDPRWTSYLDVVPAAVETPLKPGAALNGAARPPGFDAWYKTNVYQQRQPGYCVATVTLPLAISPRGRCGRLPTSPGGSWAIPSAPRSSRTSSCAGCARPICRRSTRSSLPSVSASPARTASPTSSPARAPTPASSASPRRAVWRASCARAC
jgi:sulfite reductase (ferredoxin)